MSKNKVWRFDQMAINVTDRVDDPSAAGVDRYVGLEHLDSDSLKIHRWGVPSDVEATKLRFRKGDIIFGRRRAYQRKLAVADFDGICSAHAMVLRARPDVVLPEFLPFFMKSDLFMERAQAISVGSLSPTINRRTLAAEEFALPPLEEQTGLAELLLAADMNCSTLRTALAAAMSVQASTHYFCFASIVASESTSSTVPISSILAQVNEKGFCNLPILAVTIEGRVVRRESLERHVSDETGDEKYIRALPGDLAYNTMRLWQGAVGVVYEQGLISPAYTVMRPIDKCYPVNYLAALLRSPAACGQYRRFVKGVASDRWRLYFTDLARIELNLPPPSQAAKLALQLDQVESGVQQLQTRLTNAIALRGRLVTQVLGMMQ